jgi:prophage maintenance system killer protein
MAKLHYLTTQDLLWINLQVTRRVNHFKYAYLEEVMAYQYGYGKSTDLFGQAARFSAGFLRLKPFDAGNAGSSFVSLLAFLEINDQVLTEPDDKACGFFMDVVEAPAEAAQRLRDATETSHHDHGDEEPDVQRTVFEILERYPLTVKALEPNFQPERVSGI